MEYAADRGTILLSQITECAICLQTWTDPRSLPACDHTFCLQCLKNYLEKKERGEMVCPVCRKEFNIPEGGMDALTKNFLHQQLLEAHQTTSLPEPCSYTTMAVAFQEHTQGALVLCELCENNVIASSHCIECDQSICAKCSASHLRARASNNHNIVEVTVRHNPQLISKCQSTYCVLHKEEEVKLFCYECQVVVCTICYATKHIGHKGSAIEEAAVAFQEKLTKLGGDVDRIILEREIKLNKLEMERNEFLKMLSDNELRLEEKKNEMKRKIEEEAVQMWQQLIEMKGNCIKDLNIRVEEAERDLAAVKGLKDTSKKLEDCRSNFGYICTCAQELLAQVEVLLNCTTEESSSRELALTGIIFKAAVVPNCSDCEVRLVGVIECVTDMSPLSLLDNKKPITLDQLFEKMLKAVTNDAELQAKYISTLLEAQCRLQVELDEMTSLKDEQMAAVSDLTKQHAAAALDLKIQLQAVTVKQKKSKEKSRERENRIKSLEEQLIIASVTEANLKLLGCQVCMYLLSPLPDVGILNAGAIGVCGLAVVHTNLYIAYNGSSLIQAFCCAPFFGLSRMSSGAINIHEDLNSPQLAACLCYNCLYVSSQPAVGSRHIKSVIYRANLSNNSLTKWNVMGYCQGLSVTKHAKNLLVTLSCRQVQEYTTYGSFIREIVLHESIDNPQHCVQLCSDNFVVTHTGSREHRICLVDANGLIIQSYGESQGSKMGQLNYPCQLSVDRNNHIYVADGENNRIELLSPTLKHLGYIQKPSRKQLQQPHVTAIDEINNRLYIGQRYRGSVVVLGENLEFKVPQEIFDELDQLIRSRNS